MLQLFWLLLRQPLQARPQIRTALLSTFGLMVSGIILTIALMIWDDAPINFAFGFRFAAGIMVAAWWYAFVGSMRELALPDCLQLLPQLKCQLRYATAAIWLLVTLLLVTGFEHPAIFCLVVLALATTLLMDLSRQKKQWALATTLVWIVYGIGAILLRGVFVDGADFSASFIQNAHTLLLYFVLVASVIGLMAVFRLTPVLASPILLFLISSYLYLASMKPNASMWADLPMLRQTFAVHMPALTVASVIFFVWMLAALTGRWRVYVNTLSMGLLQSSPGRAVKIGELNPLWVYSLSLDRMLKRNPSADQLMPYLFGQSSHWGVRAFSTTVTGCFALLLLFLAGQLNFDAISTFLSFALPMYYITSIGSLHESLYATRREQALLSLTPGFLQSGEQNRWLLNWLIHHWLGTVMFGVITYILVESIYVSHTAANDFGTRLMLTAVVFLLGALGRLMLDYSCFNNQMDLKEGSLFLIMTVLLPLIMLMSKKGQLCETALVVFSISIALVFYRYRRMMRSPHVFPVGRLASDDVE